MVNKMKIRGNLVNNIIKVGISNFFILVSGILTSFLLPKMFGVTNNGYYRLFTLYSTYTIIFNIGITSGIYLKYGGYKYEELDKEKFRTFFWFLFILLIFVSFVIILLSIFFVPGEFKYIFVAVAIYLIFNTISNYFENISIITQKFNTLSIRNVVRSLLTIFSVLFLYTLKEFNSYELYRLYLILFDMVFFVCMMWYVITYRKIIFGKRKKLVAVKGEIVELIRMGMPLLIADLMVTFILSIDRQFVSFLFSTDDYSIYSFAYSMLKLVTTFVAAIASVLYPSLKRLSYDKLKANYGTYVVVISILSFIFVLSYFPLYFIVTKFLPDYSNSLIYFRVLFPGIAVSSIISIIFINYYKALKMQKMYLCISIGVLLLSAAANVFAYLCFKSMISISVASVVCILFWYIICDIFIFKKYNICIWKIYIFVLIKSLIFYIITHFFNIYVGFALNLIAYILSLLIFIKEIKQVIFVIKKKDSDDSDKLEQNKNIFKEE